MIGNGARERGIAEYADHAWNSEHQPTLLRKNAGEKIAGEQGNIQNDCLAILPAMLLLIGGQKNLEGAASKVFSNFLLMLRFGEYREPRGMQALRREGLRVW